MKSNKVVKLWTIAILILLFTGCGGNLDDSAMVVNYFHALADKGVDEICEMTDPYQRSPRVDYHLQQLAEIFAGGDGLEKWTYSVVARSDSTVRYRVTVRENQDLFIELVNRDDKWYAASIPGPVYWYEWEKLNYYHKRPSSNNYPRYSEVFGTGSSIDSSKSESDISRRAAQAMQKKEE